MLEALVKRASAGQVTAHFGPDMGFSMEQEPRGGDDVLFRFTRNPK